MVSTAVPEVAIPRAECLWYRLRDGFASIRLAIGLFILIAVIATIGTIIPQGEPTELYVSKYGELASWWLSKSGLTDLYHSWWFTGLLLLLSINSLTCFSKRFPAIWRSVRQDKTNVTLPFILGLKHTLQLELVAEKKAVAGEIAAMLAVNGYRIAVGRRDEEVTLFAAKGLLGRIAAHVAHLSVPVILLGGLVGAIFGFREFGAGVEGETYYIVQGDFQLRVDRFWMDYYDNGAVESYNSRLTVIDHGEEVLTKTIRVNDPLVYKGIWFYQSSYGDAWDRIEKVGIRVSDKATGTVLREVILDGHKETVVEDLGLRMAVTDFVADFGFDPHNETVFSKSVEHRNPAVKVMIAEGDRIRASPWLLFALPGLIQVQESKYRYELLGYRPTKFTGLQIARDPGVVLVWIGSTMLVVGMTLSAFIYHRRLWAKLLPSEHGTIVYLGGSSHKSRIDFVREFTRLSEQIKRMGPETRTLF